MQFKPQLGAQSLLVLLYLYAVDLYAVARYDVACPRATRALAHGLAVYIFLAEQWRALFVT